MTLDLKGLTIPKMLAQRVMPRLEGARLSDKNYMADVVKLIDAGIGGFIIFGGDFWEVRQILPKLQARAKVPLMIASDMEKGAGQQFKGATVFPCQMAVAAATDLVSGDGLGLLSEMLDAMAFEARCSGVHAILGPVLDVNSNPHNPIINTRAFSDEPQVVSSLGEQYVKGMQGAPLPVMACSKHFPGHGEAGLDSHSVLPVIDKDKDSLEDEDMFPFRRSIMAGVEMVMTAHLKVPALDPHNPASLSQVITRGYLRNRSGFDGIIITDAMSMAALTGHYAPREAARLAIKAGADILLHPAEPFGFLDALNDLAKNKEITKEEIYAPASRIMRAKAKYCNTPKVSDKVVHERLEADAGTAQSIARRALTLVKAAGAFPALKEVKGKVAHIVLEDDGDAKAGRALRSALARQKNLRNLFVTKGKIKEMRSEVTKTAKGSALTVVSIFSKVSAGKGTSGLSPELMELGHNILQKNKKSVVVSFGSPYILQNFMGADYVVAAYDPGEAMQGSAYRALMGEIVFMGELPVRISG